MPELDPLDVQVIDRTSGPVGRVLRAARARLDDVAGPDPELLAGLCASATTGGGVIDLSRARRHVVRTIVIAGIVGAGATGAAAANGSLPSSIQGVAHDVADAVGLDIPEGATPPTSGGAQDGDGHGRSDEAPGRPDEPGQPADPGSRADESPGAPDDVPTGVGPDGITPGDGGTIPGTGETIPPTQPEGHEPPADPGPPTSTGQGTPPADPGPPESAGSRATTARSGD